jgi:hypothetical protein
MRYEMTLDMEEWLVKVEKVKGPGVDLSRDEDLSIAIMNLISLEEHFYFTAMKTDDSKFLQMLDHVRKLRIDLMKKIVTDPEGEEWCISKHLLAASMRLTEVGTKELSKGKDAQPYFRSAFDLYSLFFSINLKLIESGKIDPGEKNSVSKFSKIVAKIVDCCKEW